MRMILNNAENIMYGDKEVDRVFCGKTLVWERNGYKWINDKNDKTKVLRFQGNLNNLDEYDYVVLNTVDKNCTATCPIEIKEKESLWENDISTYRNIANKEGYESYIVSPASGYNVFGDKIIINNVDGEECLSIEYKESENMFANRRISINYGSSGNISSITRSTSSCCSKIEDYAFAGRKIGNIGNFEDWYYGSDSSGVYFGLHHVGKGAFQNTILGGSWEARDIDFYSISNYTTYDFGNDKNMNESALTLPIYIGKYAFANSNILRNIAFNQSPMLKLCVPPSNYIEKFNNVIDEWAFFKSSVKGVLFGSECKTESENYIIYILKSYSFAESDIVVLNGYLDDRYGIVDNVTSGTRYTLIVETNSFANCKNLEVVKFYGYVNIKSDAFSGCTNLKTIIFDIWCCGATIEKGAFSTQVANNCSFIVFDIDEEDIAQKLIESGVPENLITIDD